MTQEWQPIETAPVQKPVLTYRQVGLQSVAEMVNESGKWVWYCTDGCGILNVTHWMPLPNPPKQETV